MSAQRADDWTGMARWHERHAGAFPQGTAHRRMHEQAALRLHYYAKLEREAVDMDVRESGAALIGAIKDATSDKPTTPTKENPTPQSNEAKVDAIINASLDVGMALALLFERGVQALEAIAVNTSARAAGDTHFGGSRIMPVGGAGNVADVMTSGKRPTGL